MWSLESLDAINQEAARLAALGQSERNALAVVGIVTPAVGGTKANRSVRTTKATVESPVPAAK